MAIPFICPFCYRINKVADECAGRPEPCPSCGRCVNIPYSDNSPRPFVFIGDENAVSPSNGRKYLGKYVFGAFCVFGLLAVGAGFLRPASHSTHSIWPPPAPHNNLRTIGIALLNYQAAYKTFPPAYIADEKGRPKHSWRVLILPFLEQQRLYDRYNFDEPWHSKANLKVAWLHAVGG